jgi:isopenicillin-N epimerase
VLFLSHVLYTTGMILPVAEICRAARGRGVLTVIDGAHAPGMIALDLARIGCDFYGANLHKWLLAPVGTAFLFVAPGNADRLQPLVASWGYYYDRNLADARTEFGGTHRQHAFEFEGSRDLCPWLTVPEVILFHEHLGVAAIRHRHHVLSDRVRLQLDGLGGLQLATPARAELRGGLTAFRLPAVNPLALRQALWEKYRIEINIIEHAEGNLLRVSTHFYNTEAEVDRLALALRDLLQ